MYLGGTCSGISYVPTLGKLYVGTYCNLFVRLASPLSATLPCVISHTPHTQRERYTPYNIQHTQYTPFTHPSLSSAAICRSSVVVCLSACQPVCLCLLSSILTICLANSYLVWSVSVLLLEGQLLLPYHYLHTTKYLSTIACSTFLLLLHYLLSITLPGIYLYYTSINTTITTIATPITTSTHTPHTQNSHSNLHTQFFL